MGRPPSSVRFARTKGKNRYQAAGRRFYFRALFANLILIQRNKGRGFPISRSLSPLFCVRLDCSKPAD